MEKGVRRLAIIGHHRLQPPRTVPSQNDELNWNWRKIIFTLIPQYDLSASTYSPDGRIFQVEYANKAVENSGYVWASMDAFRPMISRGGYFSLISTVIGLKLKDGIVLAAEKLVASKLLVSSSNRRVQTIDLHIGMVSWFGVVLPLHTQTLNSPTIIQ